MIENFLYTWIKLEFVESLKGFICLGKWEISKIWIIELKCHKSSIHFLVSIPINCVFAQFRMTIQELLKFSLPHLLRVSSTASGTCWLHHRRVGLLKSNLVGFNYFNFIWYLWWRRLSHSFAVSFVQKCSCIWTFLVHLESGTPLPIINQIYNLLLINFHLRLFKSSKNPSCSTWMAFLPSFLIRLIGQWYVVIPSKSSMSMYGCMCLERRKSAKVSYPKVCGTRWGSSPVSSLN